jgi:hypothetical protein
VLSYVEAQDRHRAVVAALDLTNPSIRGSGTATVCASLAAAALFHTDAPLAGLIPATTLGTDTDTIATMAAAIVGATGNVPLPNVVQDKDYLEREAKRLAAIPQGLDGEEFAYPDLLTWTPPRSQVDAVGVVNGRLALSGLALLHTIEEAQSVSSRGAEWSWVGTDFGQSMLVKKRHEPHDLSEGQKPAPVRFVQQRAQTVKEASSNMSTAASAARPHSKGSAHPAADEPSLFDRRGTPGHDRKPAPSSTEGSPRGEERRVDVDEMLRWVWQRKLSDEALGYALRRLAESGSTEQLIAFTATVRGMVLQKNREQGP